MNPAEKILNASEGADTMSLSALETMISDKRDELEEDQATLAELRAGGDTRVILEKWIARAVAKTEQTLKEVQQYYDRMTEFSRMRAEGIDELRGGE